MELDEGRMHEIVAELEVRRRLKPMTKQIRRDMERHPGIAGIWCNAGGIQLLLLSE